MNSSLTLIVFSLFAPQLICTQRIQVSMTEIPLPPDLIVQMVVKGFGIGEVVSLISLCFDHTFLALLFEIYGIS